MTFDNRFYTSLSYFAVGIVVILGWYWNFMYTPSDLIITAQPNFSIFRVS